MESNQFVDGFKDFQKKYNNTEYLIDTVPKICVIGCCDSRVDPALILDAKPGDLFVIRNVANLVPPFQIYKESLHRFHSLAAGLELAVKTHKVEAIVVLGHSKCGGINHLFNLQNSNFEFIDSWVSVAKNLVEQVDTNLPQDQQQEQLEKLSIANSLNNLLSFPWIMNLYNCGQLTIHGIYFDFVKGKLQTYNPYLEQFQETNFNFN